VEGNILAIVAKSPFVARYVNCHIEDQLTLEKEIKVLIHYDP
jgi:hypothetical protein